MDPTLANDDLRSVLNDLPVGVIVQGPEAEILDDSIDAVLLDLSMPGMSGDQVLPLIKDRRPDLPVAIVTGHVDDTPALERADTVLSQAARRLHADFVAAIDADGSPGDTTSGRERPVSGVP